MRLAKQLAIDAAPECRIMDAWLSWCSSASPKTSSRKRIRGRSCGKTRLKRRLHSSSISQGLRAFVSSIERIIAHAHTWHKRLNGESRTNRACYAPMLRKTSSSRFAATKNPASRLRASISDLTEDTLPIALARIRIPKTPLTCTQPDGPERVHPSRRSATRQPEFQLPTRWLLLRLDRDRSPEQRLMGYWRYPGAATTRLAWPARSTLFPQDSEDGQAPA